MLRRMQTCTQHCLQSMHCLLPPKELGGPLDVLISNAAVSPAAAAISATPDEAIDKILNVNIRSAVKLVQVRAEALGRGTTQVWGG